MNQHNPRMFRLLALMALAICLGTSRTGLATAAQPKRPNVLFLLSDDQRPDTIAALGNQHIKTPNLDRLARSGTVFNRAYCMGSMVGAVCLPSRTMILTGRKLFHINPTRDIPIFPKTMKEAGYDTLRSGKRGNNPPFANNHFHRNNIVSRSVTCSQAHADVAIDFLREDRGDKPFFLYVAFADPHDPKRVPQPYMDMYDAGDMPLPPDYLPLHPFDNGDMTIRDEKLAGWPRTKDEIRAHLADYYSVITFMDAQIGRILKTLEETGQADNTIIIFSSDHGLAIGSHGLMGKQNLYEHSMGVPLVFTGPGIPQGKSTDAFAYLFDIFPTVCDLVGIDIPPGVEGKSLVPIMQGKKQKVRDSIFTAYKVQRAVRDERWKLIRYTHNNQTQLFDLEKDPYETKNLADDKAHAAKVEELLALLKDWQTQLDDPRPLTAAAPSDPTFTPPPAGAAKKKRKKQKS